MHVHKFLFILYFSTCEKITSAKWFNYYINQLHENEPFLRSSQLYRHSRSSQHFMETKHSLPCSQEHFNYYIITIQTDKRECVWVCLLTLCPKPTNLQSCNLAHILEETQGLHLRQCIIFTFTSLHFMDCNYSNLHISYTFVRNARCWWQLST
jgi:hypothetical protein